MRATIMAMPLLAIPLLMTLAAGSPAKAQESDLAKYCKADVARLCPAVQPGGGRIIKCLKAHTKEMSVGCAQALQKMKG